MIDVRFPGRPRLGSSRAPVPPESGPPSDPPAPPERTPAEIVWDFATTADWPGTRPIRPFFDLLVGAVEPNRRGTVLAAAGPQADIWERLLTAAWPELTVLVAREDEDESVTHARLSAGAPVDVIVHAADVTSIAQSRTFRRVFMHLRAGGIYLTPRLVPPDRSQLEEAFEEAPVPLPNEDAIVEHPYQGDLWQLVSEAQAARVNDFQDQADGGVPFVDVRGLGRQLAEVRVISKMMCLRNDPRTYPKLTEVEADLVLADRPGLGRQISHRPADTVRATAPYVHNLGSDPYFSPVMQAPKVTLRRYEHPTCSRGQIVTSAGLIWPDTFRHHRYPRLRNIYLEESAPRFGHVRRDISEPDPLPGTWFHLDSEWPGHFGHLMTEQLGRLWAWAEAKRLEPDIKLLLTLQHDRVPATLLPFEIELLSVFGIAPEDVHVFTRPCRPEVLYSATSMFSVADYVHPDIIDVWTQAGDQLAARARSGGWPSRIFCTRSASLKRPCRNTAEVEDLYRRHGFEVARPEEHSLADQVAMFRAAEAVGGFLGSALFTLALCPTPTPVFTVGPRAYTARNEHLICALRGHPLVSAWASSEIEHPEGAWTQQAFGAGFTVDMEMEGRFLDDHLGRLPGPV